ncbi:MAG: hypothetical protein EAZ59_29255, partial [Oscillatoriales cyanobacterium]
DVVQPVLEYDQIHIIYSGSVFTYFLLTRSIVLGLGSFGFEILNFCGNSEFLAVVEVGGPGAAGDRPGPSTHILHPQLTQGN